MVNIFFLLSVGVFEFFRSFFLSTIVSGWERKKCGSGNSFVCLDKKREIALSYRIMERKYSRKMPADQKNNHPLCNDGVM